MKLQYKQLNPWTKIPSKEKTEGQINVKDAKFNFAVWDQLFSTFKCTSLIHPVT